MCLHACMYCPHAVIRLSQSYVCEQNEVKRRLRKVRTGVDLTKIESLGEQKRQSMIKFSAFVLNQYDTCYSSFYGFTLIIQAIQSYKLRTKIAYGSKFIYPCFLCPKFNLCGSFC